MKISVILINQNNAPLLLKSIDSVKNQTYSNVELIVIDDASTDFSRQIIDQSTKGHPGAKPYYRQGAGGYHECLKDGIERVTGDFAVILNSTEFLSHFDFFALAIQSFKKFPQASVVYGLTQAFNPSNMYLGTIGSLNGVSNENSFMNGNTIGVSCTDGEKFKNSVYEGRSSIPHSSSIVRLVLKKNKVFFQIGSIEWLYESAFKGAAVFMPTIFCHSLMNELPNKLEIMDKVKSKLETPQVEQVALT